MSTTIDQRVVEMRFDNNHFEKNVSHTMSTLEKFKQKLNLTGASKGLENINAAANKINMSGLGNAVETVRTRFSALEIMGITALANITNSAVNAGKRIVSALTIDPVKTGFSEYELKMNSVQTIMASTGESLETVNGYLAELNEYSDKTIYSFSDMTQNIGKFTNAGVKLEDAVMAIKGISNEAAVSGANANEASRAMYNFAQALSAGYVKLIDWKSIENANMATVEFKNQLIEAAVAAGTLTKRADGMYETLDGTVINATKNFNDSLQDQWMTTEVLVGTLRNYADETTDIGKKASEAATQVKTWTQLFDTLKESAQSGWATTWEIVFGDFYEARDLFTALSKSIGGIIDKMSDARNKLLKGALGSKWDKFTDQINGAGIATDKFTEKLKTLARGRGIRIDDLIKEYGSLEEVIKKGHISSGLIIDTLKEFAKGTEKVSESTEGMTDKLEYFQDVVNKVWHGDFKNGAERIKALTDAGYDYATVQDLVNKTVDGHKLTLEDLSDAQLENLGYTKEQIESIRKLADEAKKAGTPLNKLIDDLNKPSGRELLFESLHNSLKGLEQIFGAVRTAWSEIFPEVTIENTIYNALEGMSQFTENLLLTEEGLADLTSTLKGLFAALGIINTFSLGLANVGFKVLCGILGVTKYDFLDMTAAVGDAIVEFRNFLFCSKILEINLEKIGTTLVKGIVAVKQWIESFLALPGVKKTIDALKESINGFVDTFANIITGLTNGTLTLRDIFDSIKSKFDKFVDSVSGSNPYVQKLVELLGKFKDALMSIPGASQLLAKIKSNFAEAVSIGKDCIAGIKQGLTDGTMDLVGAIKTVAIGMINAFKALFDINSPSKVFIALGGFIIAGLIYGLKNGMPDLYGVFENIADGVITLVKNVFSGLKNVDFGTVLAAAFGTGLIIMVNKTIKVLDKLATPIEGLGKILSSIKNTISEVGDTINRVGKAKSMELRTEAILNIAKALAIVTASIIALTFVDTAKLWDSVKIIAALSAILVALAFAMEKISNASISITKGEAKIGGFKTGLIAIAGSLLVLAAVVKIIGGMDPEQAERGFLGLIGLIISISGVLAAYGLLVKGKSAQNINKAGGMLIKLGVTLLLLVAAAKLISGMTWDEMGKATAGISAFVGVVTLLTLIGMIPGKNVKNIGKMMTNISVSLLLMIGVAKLINTMTWDEMGKAAAGIAGLIAFIAILMTIAMIPGKNVDEIGKMLLGISGAILILGLTAKLIAGMEWEAMGKAAVGLLGLSVIIGVLVGIVKLLGSDAPKMAATLLGISVAIGILAGVAVILSMIDPAGLQNGIQFVGLLSLFMAAMITATRGASDCKGNLIVMTVAIGIMTAAVAILSTIDPEKLKGPVVAMGLLMTIFAIMTKVAGNASASIGSLVMMTVVVGLLAFVIYKLSELPVDSVATITVGLSVLLLSFAASLAIISGAAPMSTAAIPALAAMLVVVGVLALILGALTALDCAPSLETSLALSVLLLAMAGVLGILALIGPAAVSAIAAAGAFDAVVVIIGALLIAIGALMTYVPQAEEFLDKGIEVLEKIGHGLGSAIGNIVAGFAESVMSSLPGIAESLSGFMEKLTPFIDGISSIKGDFSTGMTNLNDGLDAISLTSLLALSAVGDSMKSYAKSVKDLDMSSISNSSRVISELAKTVKSLSSINADHADEFKDAIKTLAKTGLDKFVKTFTDSEAVKDAKNAGKKLIDNLVDGIESKESAFKKSVKAIAKTGADAASDKVSSFESAGKDLGDGLVAGIKSKETAAYNAGYALGQAAVQGEKDGQKSNSPSKLTIQAGKWLGEGLIVGMNRMSNLVYGAGNDLGSNATDSISSALGRIRDLASGDMNIQPTIRPVLDLSDVRAGAGAIDSLFSMGASVGVMSNVGAISTMMNRRQNGTGNEVVSAINDLKRSIGQSSGNVYTINGVTYDDGSNVSNAVEALVRAARIERRV